MKFVLWESLSCMWCIMPIKPRTLSSTLLHNIKYGFRTRHITWKHPPSPPAKEFQATPSVWKITATLVDSLDRGDIVNAERICGRCNWEITEGHSSHKTRDAAPKLHHLAWQRQVPPILPTGRLTRYATTAGWATDKHFYNPDFAYSVFSLFGHLKNNWAGKRCARDADVKQAVNSWQQTLDTNGIQALLPRSEKCLNVNGY
jgi:hypothetical protein